jgi:tellurite resistance protein
MARSCAAWAHVWGTPIGHSASPQRHSRSRTAPAWSWNPQLGSAPGSTTTPGHKLVSSQRVTCVWGSFTQALPVGTWLPDDDGLEPVDAVGSAVPVPVLTCCRQANAGSATSTIAMRRMTTSHRAQPPRGANFRRMRYRRAHMTDSPFVARLRTGVAGHADAHAALGVLAGVLSEDAIFVFASGVRDVKDGLDGLLQRRGLAYASALEGLPHTRMTAGFDAWYVDLSRALAPVSPPTLIPMMGVVREKMTLETGARGLRSLFSSKPSDKEVTRVKRYGTLAVRTLRAVLAADGPLDSEERRAVAAIVAALGLPDSDASALLSEAPVPVAVLDVYGEMDHAVARAIVRGAWLAAASDGIDPREEDVIRVVGRKMGVGTADIEAARREAQEFVEWRCKAAVAAVDGVRYVLSDRSPGLGVQLAARTAAIMLPRRWRDEALAPVGQGAPVTLAGRHVGLESDDRRAVLGVAWAAALVEDPSLGRRALLRARWERFAMDLGEDDPEPRELVERWLSEALAGVARTLP